MCHLWRGSKDIQFFYGFLTNSVSTVSNYQYTTTCNPQYKYTTLIAGVQSEGDVIVSWQVQVPRPVSLYHTRAKSYGVWGTLRKHLTHLTFHIRCTYAAHSLHYIRCTNVTHTLHILHFLHFLIYTAHTPHTRYTSYISYTLYIRCTSYIS